MTTPAISGLTLVYGGLYWAETKKIVLGWSFCVSVTCASVTVPDLVHVCSVAVDMERMVGHDCITPSTREGKLKILQEP